MLKLGRIIFNLSCAHGRRGVEQSPPPYKTHYPPRKIETQSLRGSTYVFLIKLFRYLLEQYLTFHIHFTITA